MQQRGIRHRTKKQWSIALIIIVAVIAAAIALANNPPRSITSDEAQSTASVLENGHIESSKYDQIKSGMSYDQVKKLIGSDGKNIFESGDKGTAGYQVSYMWVGVHGGEATISFSGEKQLRVLMKSQSGLK